MKISTIAFLKKKERMKNLFLKRLLTVEKKDVMIYANVFLNCDEGNRYENDKGYRKGIESFSFKCIACVE